MAEPLSDQGRRFSIRALVLFPLRLGLSSAIFASMFAVMIASHAIPSFALLTGQFLYAVAGVTSAAMTANDLAQRNRQLETDVANERRTTANLTAERRVLQADLETTRSRLIALEAEGLDLRAQNARLQGEIETRGRAADLEIADLRRENTQLARQVDERFVTLNGVRMTQADALRQTMGSVGDRTRRTTAANLGSLAGEAIPFYGIAIMVGATSYEVASACQNMRELYALAIAMDPHSAIPDDRDAVCGMQVPTGEELWEAILNSPQAVWSAAVSALQEAGEFVTDLEAPSFEGSWRFAIEMWDRATSWLD